MSEMYMPTKEYLYLEVSSGKSEQVFLWDASSPDWYRTWLVLRDELMRRWDIDRENMDVSVRVRFLDKVEGEKRPNRVLLAPTVFGEGWDS